MNNLTTPERMHNHRYVVHINTLRTNPDTNRRVGIVKQIDLSAVFGEKMTGKQAEEVILGLELVKGAIRNQAIEAAKELKAFLAGTVEYEYTHSQVKQYSDLVDVLANLKAKYSPTK